MKLIPVPTLHLFPVLEEKLMELLHSLRADEWQMPTIARLWTVKDVAAHLLDGNLRVIATMRDNYFGDLPGDIQTNQDLVDYLNRLNADFVKAMKRVSPAALLELMRTTSTEYTDLFAQLDPFAPAVFAVSWAGESISPNWFHTAREYTERWHHQQQIRDAVGKPGIMTKELYYPVLDTFMRALPHAYRSTHAPENTLVKISVSGDAGGSWWLIKKDRWELTTEENTAPAAHTSIDGSMAWKLFTKSWRRKEVAPFVVIEGDRSLGEPVLDMVAVMA